MKVQLNIRLEERDLRLIKKISSKRGGNSSDFIRLSIRKELARLGFLNNQDAQALEVKI